MFQLSNFARKPRWNGHFLKKVPLCLDRVPSRGGSDEHLLPSLFGENPLPPGTQTWLLPMGAPEPVIGLPTKAVEGLNAAQRQEEREVERLRKLGKIRPGQSLPRVPR